MGEDNPGAPADDLWTSQLSALGSFIRAQRRLADLSLREMAAMTSVSNAYLSQIERGLHQPSLKVLAAISAALGITSQELLSQAGFTAEVSEGSDDSPDSPATIGDTEKVVLADPRLTDGQKAALIGVYRTFVGDPPIS